LQETDLSGADLRKAKLKGANLRGSLLTGATIDWDIDFKTNISNVKCDYVFLEKEADQRTGIRERLPHAYEKNFYIGEFESRFKKKRNMLKIHVANNANRYGLAAALMDMSDNQYHQNTIQGIERTDDGVILSIHTADDTDKGIIEQEFDRKLSTTKQEDILDSKKVLEIIQSQKDKPIFEYIAQIIQITTNNETQIIVGDNGNNSHGS
jgi:HrpA-like RNA helicase